MNTTFLVMKNSWKSVRRHPGMILSLWAVNVLFAFVLAAPVFFLLKREFGHSLVETDVGKINFLWLTDILYRFRDALTLIPQAMLIPILLFVVLWIFLNAGIIGRLAAGERATLGSFAADAGRYFPRFLAVLLLSVPAYVIVFGGIFHLVQIPLAAWMKNAPGEIPVLIASSLQSVLALAFLSIVQMFLDYLKVRIVLGPGGSPLRAMERTLAFIGRSFFRAWALYLLVALLSIAAGALFLAVTNVLPESGAGMMALGFVWAQLFIVSRIVLKILLFATEIQFTRLKDIL